MCESDKQLSAIRSKKTNAVEKYNRLIFAMCNAFTRVQLQ